MTQLWLVPADEPSYQETLASPIDISAQSDKPDAFPDEARVWGVRTDPEQGDWKRNRRNLERIEPGDPLLIYRKHTGQYTATGRVGPFWRTTHVRDEYWNGGPAIDVFAIKAYQDTQIEPKQVNGILGYASEYQPQGLTHVADDRPAHRVVNQFDI